MQTRHEILHGDARTLSQVDDASVQLVVTSPPYPLVEMWDQGFAEQAPEIAAALAPDQLEADGGQAAFEAMHSQLDRTWAACHRVLVDGGICCINIGDAARTLAKRFSLWPNHARALMGARRLGFTSLPDVLWRKPTNAPNKFMGSGMLPGGAYVTYEHEYVLILRKGDKRLFSAPDKARRRRSAYFWEERNQWFSDVWTDVRGTRQELDVGLRKRSGAFPIALAWRLINMYSLYDDVVLDPFAGTGTTNVSAAMAGRHSIGIERDEALVDAARARLPTAVELGRARCDARLTAHAAFVRRRQEQGKAIKHSNEAHGMPVITRQEVELELCSPLSCEATDRGATFAHARHGALNQWLRG